VAAPRFPVVFVSSDRDEASMASYHASMPWAALSLNSGVGAALRAACGVSGIPALIVVHPDGRAASYDGRNLVLRSPEAFPWPNAPADRPAVAPGSLLLRFLALLFGFWILRALGWI
jgi:hypothetical protein